MPLHIVSQILLLLFITFQAVLSSSDQLPRDGDVDTYIRKHEHVLLNFGGSWCGYCKIMRPQYSLAAEYLKTLNIHLAAVDCTAYTEGTWIGVCAGHDIQAFPTLRKYHGDPANFENYEGPTTAEDIILFMSNKTCPIDICPPRPTTTDPMAMPGPTRGPSPNTSPNSKHANAVWLSGDGSSAVVKLWIPNIDSIHPLQSDVDPQDSTSLSILLNFTIFSNGKHLALNGDLIALQVPDPSIPPRLRAVRIPSEWAFEPSDPDFERLVDFSQAVLYAGHLITELDYFQSARNRDDPNIRYYNYHPEIWLAIIGAGKPGSTTETKLLNDSRQKVVKVLLHDRNPGGATDDSNRHYAIDRIEFEDQLDGWHDYPPRPDDTACTFWSWRCADLDDPPWYRFVWRQNFDEYGRIGCLRRKYLMWKTMVQGRVAATPWSLWLLFAVVAFWRLSAKLRRWRRRTTGEVDSVFGKKADLVK